MEYEKLTGKQENERSAVRARREPRAPPRRGSASPCREGCHKRKAYSVSCTSLEQKAYPYR